MTLNFRHSSITVNNLKKSLKFYCDILGMYIYTQKTITGYIPETLLKISKVRLTYIKLDFDDPKISNHPPRLELHYYHFPKIKTQLNQNHISFTVKNLKELYNKLKSYEIEFLSEPIITFENVLICFCRDPSGNLIELCEVLNE